MTVAGFIPSDFGILLCEDSVEPVDFSKRPDFVALTGKVSQWNRMREIAAEFRAHGACIIIGGSYASLSPDVVRPHCDILVRGEIEDIAEGFFADLRSGDWKPEYVGTKPDLSRSPMPRWDLYPNHAALTGTLQTSRGCPFECEFCDVIAYLGRKQRHKGIPQVLAELDQLYRLGYRSVFLADDNFTVYRARTKELLAALADWNRRQPDGAVQFSTQVSIDAAGDEELLRMCTDAGMAHVFIGIETPNEEALRIAKKRQNLRRDLAAEVRRFVEHGIYVEAGMIVGFDGDDAGIFQRQYEFAMRCPVPVFTIGALVAPAATPLFSRLKKDGRLSDENNAAAQVIAGPWKTNVIPLGMSRDDLQRGGQALCRALYSPEAFEARLNLLLDSFGITHRCRLPNRAVSTSRRVDIDAVSVAFRVGEFGSAEAAMVRRLFRQMEQRPETSYAVINALLEYAQVQVVFQAELGAEAAAPRPPFPAMAPVVAAGTEQAQELRA
ncbi:MAG TPA: radical SAM protein [Xanthobacteraceae bacterium]|nr:radical SAM protein [Xanthobacteraceae bacterium]